jgi:hypothetical protein
MSIFDLLFIVVVLSSQATLVAAAIAAMRGRRTHSLAILRKFGTCAVAYLAIVVLVALPSPQNPSPLPVFSSYPRTRPALL